MAKSLIWAHRGASGYAPENTLPAFQLAIDMNADGIELDVQLTKDGEIIVIHDETLDRTTNGKGWVKDHTFEEIRALDASYQNMMQGGEVVSPARKFEDYEDLRVPTLKEVLELIKPSNLTINIELKTGIIFYPELERRTVELVNECGMEDRVIYSSFNHESIKKIREIDPSAQTGFLYADGPMGMATYGKKYGVTALHPALYNLQFDGFVQECAVAGLDLNVWTVNEPEYVEMCKAAHVHGIITNYPDMVREIVEA